MITMHDIAIRSLTAQHPTLETRRFMAAVREAIGPEDYDFEAGQSKIHIRPDAYKIHASDQVIVCFEVEYGHPVSTKTMSNYSELWWIVSSYHWNIALVIVDKWGECIRGINVGDYALLKLNTEHPHKPPYSRDNDLVRMAAVMHAAGQEPC